MCGCVFHYLYRMCYNAFGWTGIGYSCGAFKTIPNTSRGIKWHREYSGWSWQHTERTTARVDKFWGSSSQDGWNHVPETGGIFLCQSHFRFDKRLHEFPLNLYWLSCVSHHFDKNHLNPSNLYWLCRVSLLLQNLVLGGHICVLKFGTMEERLVWGICFVWKNRWKQTEPLMLISVLGIFLMPGSRKARSFFI